MCPTGEVCRQNCFDIAWIDSINAYSAEQMLLEREAILVDHFDEELENRLSPGILQRFDKHIQT